MTKPQKTHIDFTKYRTPELISVVAGIVGLPFAVRSILKWVAIGALALTFLVLFLLKLTGNLTLLWTMAFELYSAPAGAIAGLAIGVAEFVRRSLSNMSRLVDLLLEVSTQVAIDAQTLATGDSELPPARDLVEDVYEQVILVITKEVLSAMFGFLGTPIYWMYHYSLNQMVRLVIKLIPRDSETPENIEELLGAAGGLTAEQGRLVASLRWTQRKLASIGGGVKTFVLIPCYAVAALVIAIILLPLAIAWWTFLAGGAEPVDPASALSWFGSMNLAA